MYLQKVYRSAYTSIIKPAAPNPPFFEVNPSGQGTLNYLVISYQNFAGNVEIFNNGSVWDGLENWESKYLREDTITGLPDDTIVSFRYRSRYGFGNTLATDWSYTDVQTQPGPPIIPAVISSYTLQQFNGSSFDYLINFLYDPAFDFQYNDYSVSIPANTGTGSENNTVYNLPENTSHSVDYSSSNESNPDPYYGVIYNSNTLTFTAPLIFYSNHYQDLSLLYLYDENVPFNLYYNLLPSTFFDILIYLPIGTFTAVDQSGSNIGFILFDSENNLIATGLGYLEYTNSISGIFQLNIVNNESFNTYNHIIISTAP
jgi:hypothetical protein